MIANVAKAMDEQASATTQIGAAVENMRRESDQAARALKEQARAVQAISTASGNTAKQIKLITHANREHSTVAARLLDQLRDIRAITDRNVRGVKETQGGTVDLLKHAQALGAAVPGGEHRQERAMTNGRAGTNGR
jgi:methyl-accepting chemotaxis protein